MPYSKLCGPWFEFGFVGSLFVNIGFIRVPTNTLLYCFMQMKPLMAPNTYQGMKPVQGKIFFLSRQQNNFT